MLDSVKGLRKALIVGLSVAIACALVATKGDVPPNFAEFLKWAVGLFVLGNMGEHAADAYSAGSDTPPPSTPTVDLSPVLTEINYIKGRLQGSDQATAGLGQGLHQVLDAVSTVQQTLLGLLKKMGAA